MAGKLLAGPLFDYVLATGLAAGLVPGVTSLKPWRDSTEINELPVSRYRNVAPPPASAPSSSPSASSPMLQDDRPVGIGMLMMMGNLSEAEIKASPTLMQFAAEKFGDENEARYATSRVISDRDAVQVATAARIPTSEARAYVEALQRGQDALDFSAMVAGEQLLQEAMNDVGSAMEAKQTPDQFARMAVERGVTVRRVVQVRNMIRERYGETARERATFRAWLVKRILPATAGAAATYILQQAYAAFKEGKGGIVNVEEIKSKVLAREIDEAVGMVDGEDDSDGRPEYPVPRSGVNDRYARGAWIEDAKNMLNGSVLNIPSTDAPLGPIDRFIPKSEPTLPPSGGVVGPGPSGSIFSSKLDGDRLSERRSEPSANVLRTRIPVPPSLSVIPPSQSYLNLERIPPPNQAPVPSTPPQNLKRKADIITPGHDAMMASQVTATYDATNTPALPGGVTGPTSARWKEYTQPYKGYNVPLTDAPNLVGIGFDAETMERKLAEGDADETPEERKKPEAMGIEHTPSETPEPAMESDTVNVANETNPSLGNKGRPAPPQAAPATKTPPPHIRY